MIKSIFLLLLTAFVALAVYLFALPDVSILKTNNPASTSLMHRREMQNPKLKSKMVWMPLDKISPHLVHAAVLSEDDTFYQHHGFDLEQIKEAIRINWEKKRYAYGGSTITQQLARTLYLSPQKNMLRKSKEALITWQLEKHLSKKRILEIYLNVIEWGKGIYGAEAAARTYFDKSAADLTPDESVALVSVLPSPRRWSPISEKAFMARRRTQLTERMRRAGYLPEEEETAVFDLDELQGGEIADPSTVETPANP